MKKVSTTCKQSKLLKVENLHAGYGPGEILKGISMYIDQGEIVALIGANGAGKTTTLLTLAGVLKPRSGKIYWYGSGLESLKTCFTKSLSKQPARDLAQESSGADRVLRAGICLCPEGRRIFPHLSVLENLRMGAVVHDTKKEKEKLERMFGYFPILKERLHQLGGTLSGGEQQMLAIARALMSEAELLMLDEPSLGLAPVIVSKIFKILQEINKAGTTILLVEQNAQQALRIAHRGYVMVTGNILFEDSSQNLLASDQVRQAYLGEL